MQNTSDHFTVEQFRIRAIAIIKIAKNRWTKNTWFSKYIYDSIATKCGICFEPPYGNQLNFLIQEIEQNPSLSPKYSYKSRIELILVKIEKLLIDQEKKKKKIDHCTKINWLLIYTTQGIKLLCKKNPNIFNIKMY